MIGTGDDALKVPTISLGKAPFYEPRLDDLFACSLAGGRMTLTPCVEEAVLVATIRLYALARTQKKPARPDLSQWNP
jgi:hypothetical protein